MSAWPESWWRQFEASYDHAHAAAGSTPTMAIISAGSVGVVVGVLAYVPPLASWASFERPWVSLGLAGLAGVMTWLAGRHGCTGRVGRVATLVDNVLYSGALAYAATHTADGYALGLAVTHALMVLAFPALAYGLTPLFALAMAVPVAMALILSPPDATVMVVLVASYMMTLALAYITGKRRELQHQQGKLHEAFSTAREIADDSVQAALASTLLGLGHFLHELKNHQTAIHANLAYLETAEALSAEGQQALRDALEAQAAEHRLVVATMDSLKKRARARNTVFLLQEILETAARESPGIPVNVRPLETPAVLVGGNREHLRVVLANLLRNAEQAGADQVVLAVSLDGSAERATLLVSDDGPGISVASRHSLFDAFGASATAGGTGFGLYLCRRYVELLGGTIQVVDSPLGGAAFEIILPIRPVRRSSNAMPRAKHAG